MMLAACQTHDSMLVTMGDVMKKRASLDFIRAELVKALLMAKESLPEEVRALLIADQNATAEFTEAFTEYQGDK